MATKRRDTKTIQLWPSGRSVEYYGDPNDGEYNEDGHKPRHPRRRGLRFYDPNQSRKDQPFVRGTLAEWREIRICERAQTYQSRDIWHHDSALIDDLIKASGCQIDGEGAEDLRREFDYEQVENLYQDPSAWDAEQCREYARDQGVDLPEVPTITCDACEGNGEDVTTPIGTKCVACKGDGEIPDPDADDDDSPHGWLTEARDACHEHAQNHPAEVFEWYRVDPWLCARLREIGEVVIDNDYGEWWGRCTTGQNNIMDGVLQRIAQGQDQDQTVYAKEEGS